MNMGVHVGQPMRVVRSYVPVAVATRRRGLRQPRRITDRAEIDRRCMNVIADRLEPLEDGLPLLPVQLAKERAQTLDERIFEQSLAVRFGNEETVQPDAQGLGDFL